jgi:hypothetical protein
MITMLKMRWMMMAAMVCACGAAAPAEILYDGSLNTTPGAQSWTSFFLGGTQAAAAGVLTVDTASPESIQGGYSRTDQSIDSTAGVTLSLDLKMLSETHTGSSNRAGFSVILLDGSAQGIEIGFWTGEVWSQDDSPLFVRAEIASFDTTADFIHYELTLQGASYALTADGSELLSGAIRDYSAFAGFPDVYETPNFIFLGDDTTSAGGSWQLQLVELAAIPEPAAGLMLSAVVVGLVTRRYSR